MEVSKDFDGSLYILNDNGLCRDGKSGLLGKFDDVLLLEWELFHVLQRLILLWSEQLFQEHKRHLIMR
jgi:hypothetical protein